MFARVVDEQVSEVRRAGGENQLVSLVCLGLRGQSNISQQIILQYSDSVNKEVVLRILKTGSIIKHLTYLTQLVEDVDDLVVVFSPLEHVLLLLLLHLLSLIKQLRVQSERKPWPHDVCHFYAET